MISILDITGIKFTQKCFQVVVNSKQIMILEKTPFTSCMIKTKEVKEKQETVEPKVNSEIKELIEEIIPVEIGSISLKTPYSF